MGSGPITVFLADDHEVVRLGVRQLLESEPDIRVVGEASTAAETRMRVPEARPDVTVLDVRFPDGDGVLICRELRSEVVPPPECLILTSYADDEALFDAIMAGAAGYLLKQVSGSDLVGAIRQLAGGHSLLDPQLITTVLGRLRAGPNEDDPRYLSLSGQERRILDLIARGLTNRQIASELFLAEKTVKNYVSIMLRKLGVERRTEAAVYAVERVHRRGQGG